MKKVTFSFKNFFKSFLCYLVSLVVIISGGFIPNYAYAKVALPDGRDDEFGENNIIFYNPVCEPGSTSPGTGDETFTGDEEWDGSCTTLSQSRANWLKGQINGMQSAASKGGIPWELIAGQAIIESGGGSNEVCPYNPLGLKGKGASCDGSHRTFSSYEEAYTHYIENITPIREAKNKFPNDPYSAVAFIQYGASKAYAQCSKPEYLSNSSHACYGHQLGDPTPGYVQSTSSIICGIQKWAKDNGYAISSVTWENYSSSKTTTASATTSDNSVKLAISETPTKINLASTSTAKWDNGWLENNSIPGIVKEDASSVSLGETPASSFTGGKPNKILLHSTEGTTVGLAAYPANNKFPAHFTVDLKKKKGYQHFPLNKPSIAIKSYDTLAGIQIEIVGFSDTTAQSESHKSSPYFLPNLSDEDWDYLALLLIAISQETGIPLSSSVTWTKDGSSRISSQSTFRDYSGVLGHQHATGNDHIDPGPIWDKVSAAIARNPDGSNLTPAPENGTGSGASYCNKDGSHTDPTPIGTGDLADLVVSWAWPDYKGAGFIERKPAYAEWIDTKATYTGGSCADGTKGVDCGAFVANIMMASGWDSNYIQGSTSAQQTYLKNNWQQVSKDSLQLGDVGIKTGHVILYVGNISGFNSKTASASLCSGTHRRAPMAGSPGEDLGQYTWYRKK